MKYVCAGMELPLKQLQLMKDQILDQCIDHYLILEYADENDIEVSDEEFNKQFKEITKNYTKETLKEALLRGYVDEDQWKSKLREQLLVKKTLDHVFKNMNPPGYDEIKQYYENNQEKFRVPRMVLFRQIVTYEEDQAIKARKRLEDGESFETIAEKYSVAPEAENGGYVGWLAEENMDESMVKVLFSLPKHKISPIVKTAYGFHIFEVLDTKPAGVEQLADKIEEIKATLMREQRERYLETWLESLKQHFPVQLNQELISQLELS